MMKAKIFFFVLTMVSFFDISFAQNALDGKKFKIDLMKDEKTVSSETLIFSNSMLQTPDRAQFKEAVAYTKPTDNYYTWAATLSSEKDGVMAWQGSVKGNTIEGKCIWRKP